MVKVTIVGGAGRMGLRTGVFLALEGQTVTLCDTAKPDFTQIRMLLDKQVSEGYYTLAESREAESRLSHKDTLASACADANVVLEMVPEELSSKEKVLRDISLHCPASCLIATNTLTLSVSMLARFVHNQERFLGIRFLFPVLNIPDMEITVGSETGRNVVDEAKTWLMSMGMSPFFKPPGGGESLVLSSEQITQRQFAHYQLKISKRASSGPVGVHGAMMHGAMTPAQIYYSDGGGNPPPPAPAQTETADECAVCLQEKRTTLLYPCGHMSFCGTCAQQLKENHSTCPLCRHVIQDIVRVYN